MAYCCCSELIAGYFALCAVFLLSIHSDAETLPDATVEEVTLRTLYDKIFNTLNNPEYDRRIRPFLGVQPTEVTVFFRVLSLRSVSEATMDYRLELFFRETWRDPRLAYDGDNGANITEISLHESLAEKIWVPDTFVPNAVKSRNPDKDSVTHRSLLRLYSNGTVLYSRRLSITAECPMDLTLYPFDLQVCILSIESYGHGVHELLYQWREYDPVVKDTVELPDYQLIRIVTKSHNVTVTTGTYSRLECCFFFKRSAAFYFVQLFLPATAIVFTSWILLCMGKGSNFSDMIAIILAVTFLYFSYTSMMPRVSYVKAMDVYLGACFLHVFWSMAKMAATKYYEGTYHESEPTEQRSAPRSSRHNGGDAVESDGTCTATVPEKFHFGPTNSSVDVVEGRAPRTVKKECCRWRRGCGNESGLRQWKTRCCGRLLKLVSCIPNNAVLYSFLLFWVGYLVVCFWLAIDTNEERCQF